MSEPATSPEPQTVVAAIVISHLGVLVGKRNDGKPPWTFIAGEIDQGESQVDAAVREVKEETGLRVRGGNRGDRQAGAPEDRADHDLPGVHADRGHRRVRRRPGRAGRGSLAQPARGRRTDAGDVRARAGAPRPDDLLGRVAAVALLSPVRGVTDALPRPIWDTSNPTHDPDRTSP